MAIEAAATFILVPGAMHGAWVWDRVAPILAAAGYGVIATDLPGMGSRKTIPLAEVTLDDWADFVAGLARGCKGPVVLAGHSRGGLVIGEAAERMPDAISGLIYVAAMIALPGQTGMAAGRDPELPPPALPSDPRAAILPDDRAKLIFYNCCTSADADWAAARLEAEPPAPLNTPAGVSWQGWGKVPRGYVECRQDKVLSLNRQRRFQAAAPCDPVITLDTDHSPFLSAPEPLAAAMLEMAEAFIARRLAPGRPDAF